LTIVVDQRLGLILVTLETLPDRLFTVVIAMIEFAPTLVAYALFLGGLNNTWWG
jgi:hypothetical protein